MAFDAGGTATGALSGAATGAAIGSVVPVIGTGIGAIGGAIIGGFGGSGLFSGGDDDGPAFNFNKPEFDINPDFPELQDELKGRSRDILSGDLPDFYKPIAEFGGDFFAGLLKDIEGDIRGETTTAVNEDLSRRGVTRGGVGTAAIAMGTAEKVGDISRELRVGDYERALGARGDLFGIGMSGLQDVRTKALEETGVRNQFELGASELELDALKSNAQILANEQSQEVSVFESINKGLGVLAGSFDFSDSSNFNPADVGGSIISTDAGLGVRSGGYIPGGSSINTSAGVGVRNRDDIPLNYPATKVR